MISLANGELNKRDQASTFMLCLFTGGTYAETDACLIEPGRFRASDTGVLLLKHTCFGKPLFFTSRVIPVFYISKIDLLLIIK